MGITSTMGLEPIESNFTKKDEHVSSLNGWVPELLKSVHVVFYYWLKTAHQKDFNHSRPFRPMKKCNKLLSFRGKLFVLRKIQRKGKKKKKTCLLFQVGLLLQLSVDLVYLSATSVWNCFRFLLWRVTFDLWVVLRFLAIGFIGWLAAWRKSLSL